MAELARSHLQRFTRATGFGPDITTATFARKLEPKRRRSDESCVRVTGAPAQLVIEVGDREPPVMPRSLLMQQVQ